MSHSFLPVFQLFEAPRISRGRRGLTPESGPITSLASNGQLCGGTAAATLFNGYWAVLKLTPGPAGTAPLRAVGAAGPRGCGTGPGITRHLISVFLLFSNRCPNK